jgi:lysyl-tRNA synthetase class II
MIGFFLVLFGCKQIKTMKNGVYPVESFSVIETTFKDNLAIGYFNMAYKNYNKKVNYPWYLRISIALNLENLYENGLPQIEEITIANRLEDELLSEMKKITTIHYIGHLFNDTFLDIYIYLDNPEEIHKYLQTQVNKEGLIRGFAYEIKKDTKWVHVEWILK